MPKRGGESTDADRAIGARIRIRRKQLGMSQSDLADRIGVSFQQVQKYERGSNRVAASTLIAMAGPLECSPASLLGGEGGGPPVEAGLLALLSEDGALDLLQAFASIPDREMRQAVIAVAAGLAGGAAQGALQRARA